MSVDLSQFDPDIRAPQPGTSGARGVKVFLMGGLGTYKTSWAAQWPKPLFFSFAREGGDKTLDSLLPCYGVTEPVPRIYITGTQQLVQKLQQFAGYYQQAGIKTVVFDPINAYQEIWMSELIMLRKHDRSMMTGKQQQRAKLTPTTVAKMDQQDWGYMANHLLHEVLGFVHTLPELNVIWIAHEKDEWEERGNDRQRIGVCPALQGQARQGMPRECDLVIHAQKKMAMDPAQNMAVPKVFFQLQAHSDCKEIRHRFGASLPYTHLYDPRPEVGDAYPTFHALDHYIGNAIAK